jgi:UDP-2,3-diacylglucosamine hydrolase
VAAPARNVADAPLVLVAGSGRLPLLVADSLARAGRAYRVLALRGFADRALAADATVDLLDVQGALGRLDAWRPGGVVLAGAVARPGPAALMGAAALLRDTASLRAVAGGDDGLLRRVVDLIEARGHPVVGVDAVAPDLLAPAGPIGRLPVPPACATAVATGRAVLAALAPFDIGQAAVVEGARVIAVEGPEGTDRMLARARPGFFSRLRGRRGGGVLVKLAKAGQDRRVDLPAIGPRTVRRAARAGLAGIAVGAGSTLVLGRAETAAAADRLGLFLVGLEGS